MKRFILISILSTFAYAISFSSQEISDCVVLKSFAADNNTSLKINNRYGTITVVDSQVDSVTICGTLVIDHANPQIALKSQSLIVMDITSDGNEISVKTNYDDRFFSPSLSSGRKSFNVNYVVKTPSYINLSIENSFGDVILDDISGSINISLSHGNLTCSRLLRDNVKPLNSITLNHSRAKIPEAKWLIVEAYHSPYVEIAKCQALSVISEYSTIDIGNVNSIVFSSKSDIYSINKVTNCISETWLTKTKISEIKDIFRATAEMSSFRIDKVERGFSEMEIIGNNSAFTIVCDGSNSFMLTAKADNAAIVVPEAYKDKITRKSESNVVFSLSGLVGTDQNTLSRVNASVSHGKLEFLSLSGK